jgi:hypothetical protein
MPSGAVSKTINADTDSEMEKETEIQNPTKMARRRNRKRSRGGQSGLPLWQSRVYNFVYTVEPPAEGGPSPGHTTITVKGMTSGAAFRPINARITATSVAPGTQGQVSLGFPSKAGTFFTGPLFTVGTSVTRQSLRWPYIEPTASDNSIEMTIRNYGANTITGSGQIFYRESLHVSESVAIHSSHMEPGATCAS